MTLGLFSFFLFLPSATLSGHILDAQTKLPLSAAVITLVGKTGVPEKTNLTGSFEFLNLPTGRYEIHIEKSLYESQFQTIYLKDNVKIEITLKPKAFIYK